jgi:PAS domain S-box-containing protein
MEQTRGNDLSWWEMDAARRPALLRYGIAVLAVIAAVTVRFAIDPLVDDRQPFVTFYGAVAIAAWFGGAGPGIVALLLGLALGDWFFLEPRRAISWGLGAAFPAVSYSFVSALLVALTSLLHRANRRTLEQTEALRRSEELHRTTLDSVRDYAIFMLDVEGKVLTWNAPAEAVKGWKAEAVLGRHFEMFYRQEDRAKGVPAQHLTEARKSGTANYRGPRVRQDRSLFDADISMTAVYASDRSVRGYVKVVRDVTGQKRAEQALRESEQRLNGIISSAMDAVISVDSQHRIVLFNAAAERMFGYSTSEVMGQTLERFIPAQFRAQHPKQIDDFGKTGVTNRNMGRLGTLTALRRSGEEFPIEAAISQVEIAGSKIYTVILRDITERRRAEQALRESGERFRAMADNIPQLAWMAEADGSIFWLNQRWFDYTGTTLEEMKGWDWQRVHHPSHVDRVTVRFKRAIELGEPWEDLFPIRGRDGGYRWFLSRAFPIRDASGHVVRWFGTNTDITELREAEEALRISEERYRKLSTELEQRVTERTREVTEANTQLREANERLKEVDRLKSEFLATMSHELRTPLNSIIGFNEIVIAELAGPLNDEQKKQLGMSLNSARHLLNLINDLLDLARIESGRVEPVPDWFDVRDVVEQVMQTLRPIAERKALPVETSITGETRLFSDRKMVFQILLNLANNAVKFTETGRVRIDTRQADGQLVLEVSDTGIGIKPENLQLLFEAFRQVDGSARRRFEGTGLGLYLSKRLAHLLGGEITVESVYGQGSTFRVRLPLSDKEKA